MEIERSDSEKFKEGLKGFEVYPIQIPKMSFMIFDDKRPLLLICIFSDSGVSFVHGLFRSTVCSLKDFSKAFQVIENELLRLSESSSLIFFSNLKSIKRRLLKLNYKEEKTSLFYV